MADTSNDVGEVARVIFKEEVDVNIFKKGVDINVRSRGVYSLYEDPRGYPLQAKGG